MFNSKKPTKIPSKYHLYLFWKQHFFKKFLFKSSPFCRYIFFKHPIFKMQEKKIYQKGILPCQGKEWHFTPFLKKKWDIIDKKINILLWKTWLLVSMIILWKERKLNTCRVAEPNYITYSKKGEREKGKKIICVWTHYNSSSRINPPIISNGQDSCCQTNCISNNVEEMILCVGSNNFIFKSSTIDHESKLHYSYWAHYSNHPSLLHRILFRLRL